MSRSEHEIADSHRVFKTLGNEGKFQVYLYLRRTGVATGAIIARNLGMNRSVVCRYLKELVAANLVVREKWFSSIVFKPIPGAFDNLMKQAFL